MSQLTPSSIHKITRDIPKASEVWQHFKGDWYRIQTIAKHTETDELLVIYQCIKTQDTKKLGIDYARPLTMFLSEVDHEKYPDITEHYRFKRLF